MCLLRYIAETFLVVIYNLNMIRYIKKTYLRFLFFFHVRRKNDFAYMQKLIDRNQDGEDVCFTYYKLGMYLSVLNCKYNGKGLLGNYANAVSFAAVGNVEKLIHSIDILDEYLEMSKALSIKLAKDLAGYQPNIALTLIENNNTLDAKRLRFALLLYIGKNIEAKELLLDFGKNDGVVDFYRINLLDSNIKKTEQLNNILSQSGLETVELLDKYKPLNVSNIYVADKLPSISSGSLVSILMTTYCSEEYVAIALNSLLNQTYRNIEIIVIDDASTDRTSSIIDSFAMLDSRIQCIKLHSNIGTFMAKNEGLKYARGEFITCHDSDDWAHPRKIELQVAPLIEKKNLISTVSHWIRIDSCGDLYARKVFPLKRLNPTSLMFKRALLSKINGWDEVQTGADSAFLAKVRFTFGDSRVSINGKILTLGSHRKDSLMTNKTTGYFRGVSLARLEYWDEWNRQLLRERD